MRTLAVSLAAGVLLLASGAPATAVDEYAVSTPEELTVALAVAAGGDTIRLANQDWPALRIEGRYLTPVVVTGPARLTGRVDVAGSSRIELRNLTVDGGQLALSADSSDISVHEMEFTRCAGICVQLGRQDVEGEEDAMTTGVLIADSSFHDYSEHAIGQVGNDIRVEGNTFDRAKDPLCTAKNCPEHIRIRGGGPWTIVGNRFGEAEEVGPQIRIWNAFRPTAHDVRIASNVFHSTVREQCGVCIEGSVVGREEGRPRRIAVVNNTILVTSNAVGLGSSWGEQQVPGAPPPLVANNVMRFEGADQCARGEFVSNVTQTVRGDCGPEMDVGALNLDGSRAPTSASTLIVGRAAPAYAPATDYRGLPRALAPDRGAIELQPLIPVLRRVYPKKAVAVEWLPADFCPSAPCDQVRFIVEDANGVRLTSFLTPNDGNAYTTYPVDFEGVRRFRVATPDETVVSAPWIVAV